MKEIEWMEEEVGDKGFKHIKMAPSVKVAG